MMCQNWKRAEWKTHGVFQGESEIGTGDFSDIYVALDEGQELDDACRPFEAPLGGPSIHSNEATKASRTSPKGR